MKEKDQSQILSYAIQKTSDKISSWFPRKDIQVWNGKLKHGVYLWVFALENTQGHNRMELLKIKRENKQGEWELQVPSPRLVDLHFSVIPTFSNTEDSLNFTALLIKQIADDPFVRIEPYNWYGNSDGTTMLEDLGQNNSVSLPEALSEYSPYKRDIKMTLGINSGREEKITKVQKRQFTAVNK